MEIIQGQNISNQTFTNAVDKKFVACNIEDCTFEGTLIVEFDRCNVKKSNFSNAEYNDLLFVKSNIINCEIDETKIILDHSNISDDEEPVTEDLVEEAQEEAEQDVEASPETEA